MITEENDLGSPRISRGMSQKALLGHLTEHIRDRNRMDVINVVDV